METLLERWGIGWRLHALVAISVPDGMENGCGFRLRVGHVCRRKLVHSQQLTLLVLMRRLVGTVESRRRVLGVCTFVLAPVLFVDRWAAIFGPGGIKDGHRVFSNKVSVLCPMQWLQI